jgi:hypothetical protein
MYGESDATRHRQLSASRVYDKTQHKRDEHRRADPSSAQAAAARLAMSIPITFRRRLSALNAKVFVSSIVYSSRIA